MSDWIILAAFILPLGWMIWDVKKEIMNKLDQIHLDLLNKR